MYCIPMFTFVYLQIIIKKKTGFRSKKARHCAYLIYVQRENPELKKRYAMCYFWLPEEILRTNMTTSF